MDREVIIQGVTFMLVDGEGSFITKDDYITLLEGQEIDTGYKSDDLAKQLREAEDYIDDLEREVVELEGKAAEAPLKYREKNISKSASVLELEAEIARELGEEEGYIV